jgi:hypothetical protein
MENVDFSYGDGRHCQNERVYRCYRNNLSAFVICKNGKAFFCPFETHNPKNKMRLKQNAFKTKCF